MTVLLTGQPAPVFTLPDLEGRPVNLEEFLGKTVLINFWSAECPWAERADRLLVDLQERIALLSIASNANEPPELLRATAFSRGLRTVLLDPIQEVADLYGAVTTPHLFLLDAGGLLRYQGAVDDMTFRQREPTRIFILEAVEALLDGRPVMIDQVPPYGCTIVRHFDEA